MVSPNYVNQDYFFIFSSHFDRASGLDMGRLSLNSLSSGTIDIWVASSSVATKQYPESFHERGGLIPPQYRVLDLKNWTVDLYPIYMPNHPGIRGNFYKIEPYSVTTDKGGKRGDFGLHKDANHPGSLGCIVMSNKRFESFENRVSQLIKKEVSKVPLFVQYS